MLLIKSREALRSRLQQLKNDQKSVGFVPTMGALHEGHLSLIKASEIENDVTVCSIFVNPTQFNDPKDFEKYPVTLESDIQKLEAANCNIVFIPSKNEIYPSGHTRKRYELGYFEDILEGKYRPGHFQGVCEVVEILLKILQPDKLYLGQKDLQQCKVIGKLLDLTGMKNEIKLVISPTMREKDGLAMSSRNMRLSAEERNKALSISRVLRYVVDNRSTQAPQALKKFATDELIASGLRVDYVEIVNADTLLPIENWSEAKNIAVLVAAFAGEIRLIDNMVVENV